jgi:2-iminobutanoate/2-iminopropanoate deaminase
MTNREAVETGDAPAAVGPYSQGIRAGGFVFTAGQLGIDSATGELVSDGVAEQAERALRNLAAVLEAGGSSLSDVVKVTVFLADIADWPVVNDVYARLVPEPFPARSAFAVRDLPKAARVEIEAIAVARSG